MSLKNHGITKSTPSNILFGAGVYYRNLVYENSAWKGTALGATNGGGKLSVTGEFVDLELDGALVKVKGLTVKAGGTGSMEVNLAELTEENLKAVSLFSSSKEENTNLTVLKDKANIEEGDYIPNLAFVGTTADKSKNLIVIFDNALCTSGLELEGKNKEGAVITGTFEAYSDDYDGELDTLPIRIYIVPKTAEGE